MVAIESPEEPDPSRDPGDVTLLLRRVAAGDKSAEQILFDLIFTELRRLAAAKLRRERPGHTLQATALVNEAYMRMQNHPAAWTGKPHFMALAAQAMRRILADYGRSRGAEKRSAFSNAVPLELAKDMAIAPGRSVELVDLDDALTKLAEFDPESAKVVEMRYFGGLTEGEIGELLGCSSRTVKRKWEKARAWLSEVLRP